MTVSLRSACTVRNSVCAVYKTVFIYMFNTFLPVVGRTVFSGNQVFAFSVEEEIMFSG